MTMRIGCVLFDGFETLDMFGPVELFGMHEAAFEMRLVAEAPGPVRSAQGWQAVAEAGFDDLAQYDILLVPGGAGTRREVDNPALLGWLKTQAEAARFITSVCTGSALLARAGLLDGKRATSNKRAFDWVTQTGPRVDWVYHARWVEDGRFWTSSGVSAGMDMTLALIAHLLGRPAAENAADWAEYTWHRDADRDPFATQDRA